eukprot:IDg15004t1
MRAPYRAIYVAEAARRRGAGRVRAHGGREVAAECAWNTAPLKRRAVTELQVVADLIARFTARRLLHACFYGFSLRNARCCFLFFQSICAPALRRRLLVARCFSEAGCAHTIRGAGVCPKSISAEFEIAYFARAFVLSVVEAKYRDEVVTYGPRCHRAIPVTRSYSSGGMLSILTLPCFKDQAYETYCTAIGFTQLSAVSYCT